MEQQFSDEVKKGRVIESSPAGGTTVERGTTVTLTVSRGAETVEVPDVTGESEDNARSAIEGAGLRVGKVTEQESDEEPGTVTAQDPAPGTSVNKNTAVALTVAKAVPVPDVVDLDEDEARQQLEDAGFDVRVEEQTVTDQAQDGVVLEQTPGGRGGTPPGQPRHDRRRPARRADARPPTPSPTTTPVP